jgi:hypothetical protein
MSRYHVMLDRNIGRGSAQVLPHSYTGYSYWSRADVARSAAAGTEIIHPVNEIFCERVMSREEAIALEALPLRPFPPRRRA